MIFGIVIGILIAAALAFVLAPVFSKTSKKGKKDEAALKKSLGVLTVFVILLSVGLYYLVGRPELIDPPAFPENFGDELSAQQAPDQLPPIEVMVEQLKARLDENPGDVQGWSLLGQSLMVLGRYGEATEAYTKAIVITPDDATLHSALGETIVLQDDGLISEAAAMSFQNALLYDPSEPISRFYMGDYAFQEGDIQLAYDRWLEVYNDVPPETPWLELLEQRLGEAAGRLGIDPPAPKVAEAPSGLTSEEVQNMSEEDQRAMIEGMVANLAARLEDNPDDLEGWARLGRSYMVLGRFEEGAEAYSRVAEALPGDVAAQQQYAQALLTHLESEGLGVNNEAFLLLTRLLELDGNNPTALFYLGQAEAERGNNELARGYWEKLLNLFGQGSPDAPMIQEKLDSLG